MIIAFFRRFPAICTDVLQTALDIISSLPPLSLASDTKMSTIGRQSLDDVSRFLRSVALPSSSADAQGTWRDGQGT